ncbi:MAG TPA: hypothetical protein VHQ90_16500 [Thermoanaerobaculia bacterium]|nr:hypothetical protein [Thermoanaerobaculia bacterium]
MAREIGGRADKDGNEFERLWLAWQALRVLQGDVTSLHWERAGEIGFGIELELSLPDGWREVQQCKIENGTEGRWSAADLAAAGVLGAALRHLQRPGIETFVFVSRDPVPVLRDLAERSHRADGDPELFLQTALSSKAHREQFERLCKEWKLDPKMETDCTHAFALLQQVRFETGIWGSQRGHLELTAGLAAEGAGREIVSSLVDFLYAKLGDEIYSDQIREHLRESGHAPRDLRGDSHVPAAIEKLRQSFEHSLDGLLLGGKLLPRLETRELLGLLDDPAGPRVVLLHGPAGIGKSDVELELTWTLAARGTPFLAVRLDSQRPAGSVSKYSRDVLELPAGEPAYCLAALAGGRPAILLIDQLDALRWTSGHSAEALRVCKEIVQGALAVESIRVVLACRTFDLDSDPTLKAWERELTGRSPGLAKRVEVKLLSAGQVESFVAEQGGRYADLSKAQQDLLRHPYTLFLWWDLFREKNESPAFVTKTGLLFEYRRNLDRKLVEMGQFGALSILDPLVSFLDEQGRLDAPVSLVGGQAQALEALQSLNVLRAPRHGVVTFTHQSLLDFLIAERVAREALGGGQKPINWLRIHDQSLFRRDQLRQLLVLLRDQDRQLYIATLEEIFGAEDIRFHLQRLALGMLRETSQPLDDERRLGERLLTTDDWRQHVLDQVVSGHQGWFETLDDAGLFSRWLESGSERPIALTIEVCRSVAVLAPERLERLLMPYWETGDEGWKERIDSVLGHELHQLTPTVFGWRVERARVGSRSLDWFYLEELARRNPARAFNLLEGHLLYILDQFEASGQLAFDPREPEREVVGKAAEAAPEEAWNRLLPILLRSLDLFWEAPPARGEHVEFLDYVRSPRRGLVHLNTLLRKTLARAGGELSRREGLGVVDRLAPLLEARSKSLQRLVLYSLQGGPDELADFAMQWLAVEPRRFQLGSVLRDSVAEPAKGLIKRFAGICSAEIYQELEARLLVFHPRYEMHGVRAHHRDFEARGPLSRSGYGRAQHILLFALPRDRMSTSARERLAGWNTKFGEPPKGQSAHLKGEGSAVHSSIPHERVALLSDRAWLSIIIGDWKEKKGGRKPGWRLQGDRFVERSDKDFARTFGVAARLFPERFAALLLLVPSSSPREYIRTFLLTAVLPPPPPGRGATADCAPASVQAIEKVLRHFEAHLQEDDLASAVCRLVEARAKDAWSEWAISLVRSYAEHRDPESALAAAGTGEAETAEEEEREEKEQVDLDVAALNSVRGVAAGTLMKLMFAKPELRESCLPTVERLAGDPHPVVRVAAQGLCLPLYNFDRDRAFELFVRCCGHRDDRVLGGLYASDFLRYTWHRYPEKLAPVLKRMVRSGYKKVAEQGAFWATIGHIGRGLYSDLAAKSLRGHTAHRKGAANAVAVSFRELDWRQAALPLVMGFFEDEDPIIVAQVVGLLREEAILESQEGPVLAEAFVQSPALASNAGDLFHGLAEFGGSLVPYAPAIEKAVARLAGQFEAATRNPSTRIWGAVRLLPPVLLRLYEQAEGPALKDVRNRCLDTWDVFLRGRLHLGRDVLGQLDA